MRNTIKVGSYTVIIEPYGDRGQQIRISVKEFSGCSEICAKEDAGIVPDIARTLIFRKLMELRAEKEKKRPKLRMIKGGKDEHGERVQRK